MRAVSAEGLLKLKVDLRILNVYLESLIFYLIGSVILNVVFQKNFQRHTL